MKIKLSGQRAYRISYLVVFTFILYGCFVYFSQQTLFSGITKARLSAVESFIKDKQQEQVSRLQGRADSLATTIAKLIAIQLENIQAYGLQKEGMAASLEPFMDYPEIAGIEVAGTDGRTCAAIWKSAGKVEFRTDYSLPASFRDTYSLVVKKAVATGAGDQGTVTVFVDDRYLSETAAKIRDELHQAALLEIEKLRRHFNGTLLPQGAVLALAVAFIIFSSRVIGRSYAVIEQQREELEVLNRSLEQRVEERTRELKTAVAFIDATLDAVTDGVAALDGEGRLTSFNHNFLAMWRLKVDETEDAGVVLQAVLDQLKDPEAAEARVRYLRENPEADSMEVLELKDGRIFERYSRPQYVGLRCVGRVWSYRDVTERVRAERELREAQSELFAASRKAGMAEIATNVLHSVGNVLNSVNISATVVGKRISGSKAKGVAKVVELLKEHSRDLGAFLTEDEKGKLLPGYLESLTRAVEAEQSEIVEELGKLTKSVDHIKEIVNTQQSYAGAYSIVETVAVTELLEDALRMKAAELQLHQVKVVQEIGAIPPLPLDRARVLQILVNLIANAIKALAGTASGRQITLKGDLVGDESLRISIKDIGEGIAPENIKRIFNHGFTTRKDGHGFGLHSSALAAKEMGGTLSVESDGYGKGATFTLILPTGGTRVSDPDRTAEAPSAASVPL